MNQTIESIQKRRSVRVYENRQVDQDELAMIIEAGRYAPSGGNHQTTHIIVIQNREIIDQLEEIAQQEFAKMEVSEGMYSGLIGTINQSKLGKLSFTYHAPTLILLANKKGYSNAIADCTCVLENMMIAATSLDVATCYINQLKWLNENQAMVDYLKTLGLNDNEIICNSLIAGYSTQAMNPLNRKGNLVTYL